MSKMTLKQAIHLARISASKPLRSAAVTLDGKPFGGWPETEQAKRDIRNALPFLSDREFTIDEFIEAAYTLDSADRYRSKLWIEEAQADVERAKRALPAKPSPLALALHGRIVRATVDSDGMISGVDANDAATVDALRASGKWLAQATAYRKAWLRYESAALHAGQEVAS